MTTKPELVYNASSAKVGGGLSFALAQVGSLVPHFAIRLITAPWNAERFADRFPDLEQVRLAVPSPGTRYVTEQFLPLRYRQHAIVQPGNFASLLSGGSRTCLILQNPNYFGPGLDHAANQSRRRRLKIALSHRSVRRSAVVVAISQALLDGVQEAHPDLGDRLHLVPSGRPEPVEPAALPASLNSKRFVLSVANDYRHKNLEKVVDAWSALATSQPDLELVMAGQIDEQRRRDLAARAGHRANCLHLLGSLPDRGSVAALYQSAEVALAPSDLEAHPLTPAEAGLYGTPLVLSDIPAHREVAGTHAAFVATSASAHTWAQAADSLVRNGRRFWRPPQTWNDHGQRLAELLEPLIERASR